ncbi:MAG: hypothetical protein QW356_04210 [Candidatus Hadarchaeales archaeon]
MRPIDPARIRLLITYNRRSITDLDTYFRYKLGALWRWLYYYLEAEGLRFVVPYLRILTPEERIRFLRLSLGVFERLRKERSAFYARAILAERQARERIDRLEVYIEPGLPPVELLKRAIELKKAEEDFLAELAKSLREHVPERPEWAEETERVLGLVRKRLEELKSMVPPPPLPPPPPVVRERRVFSLYIVIRQGHKIYRYPSPIGRRYRRYPSGKFEAEFEMDAEVRREPKLNLNFYFDEQKRVFVCKHCGFETADMGEMNRHLYANHPGELAETVTPDPVHFDRACEDFLRELSAPRPHGFSVVYGKGDITWGVTNLLPVTKLGEPPYKLTLSRRVDKPVPPGFYPREDWQTSIREYI